MERPDPSCESSDDSTHRPVALKDGRSPVPLRKNSPGPSCESVKSDRSLILPLDFKDGHPVLLSREPSRESMKSDRSLILPLDFKDGHPVLMRKKSPCLSYESVKSDASMKPPMVFKDDVSFDFREADPEEMPLEAIFTLLEEHILTFFREQLQRFHRLLAPEHPDRTSGRTSGSEEEHSSREAALNITLDFLKRMKQEHVAECLRIKSSVGVCGDKLKRRLQPRYSHMFEGVAKAGNPAPLQQIYTELYLTEGPASEVNQEHEVRLIETTSRKPAAPETIVKCEDMFKRIVHRQQPIRAELAEQGPIRTVLTRGVAGVGKTVLTQKFSLDWAESRAHQDIQLLFPFTFRELNLLKDRQFSLVGLLHHFFSESKDLCSFEGLQLLFIFDGLDECRLPLDFSRTRVLTDPTQSASVEELLVNLIRGDLLPSARLWITTRPAAANQIPAECVSMVTEVRGFTDEQKEQYFMKRIRDKQQATAIISHIKSIRSLYIMSYIPIFCWILSTVLLHLMKNRQKLPQTMTQMYIHFLVVQAKVKKIKYHEGAGADLHWTPETKEIVWSLGKLAFEQLLKGNLIFSESDLRECGLDAAKISQSGVFTEVFREEPGLYQNKVYCFIHLSVQEFLAALHVHQTFFSSGVNLLSTQKKTKSEVVFYRSAVNQALLSPNGHLDLFLRFLLGLSLPTNQRLLQGLLNQTASSSWTNQETVKYIKTKLNEGLSVEKSQNLLYCLNELNDCSLMEELHRDIREEGLSDKDMSPAEWSALSFLLLSSDSDLEEFDLRKYCSSESALRGLLPVVKASSKATLSGCNLSSLSCAPLASVLRSSRLTHLDLSNNDLQDSGVELLCEGLKSAPCRLHTLRLSGCLVSERGGSCLASALMSSTPSCLRELDLSYNHLGASAGRLAALRAPSGPLDSLRLDPAGEQWMVPGLRKYSCEFFLDPNTAQRFLLLSEDKRTVKHVTTEQLYPEHRDRFSDWYRQVLSSTGLRGRCYWEVDWSGEVDIAVSYRGIRRRGQRHECVFGDNDQSWRLRIFDGHYSVRHNKRETPISSSCSRSGRVGVFLGPGALSFYSVLSDGELFHLHSFSCSFTEPLFPGFGLWSDGDSVSVVDPRTLPPGGPM